MPIGSHLHLDRGISGGQAVGIGCWIVLPSKSLKLLPILGVSLASLDATDRRGLRCARSAARLGLNVPGGTRRRASADGKVAGAPELTELVEDSAVTDFRGMGFCSTRLRGADGSSDSIRRVAFRSGPALSRGACSGPRETGRNAGDSSSSSSSSRRPCRWVENLPK